MSGFLKDLKDSWIEGWNAGKKAFDDDCEEDFQQHTEAQPIIRIPMQEQEPDPDPELAIISKKTIITGALKGTGVAKIEGEIQGEIDLDGAVTVALSGIVKGDIAAKVLRIAGNVEGNVTAKERLSLKKTGVIQGDMRTASLVIEAGGQLNGRMIMPE